uniref:BTB domain-containing protein n=1 Tax=Strongyloides papillosus TaxID=174720 RepID=A0A0N5C1Z6_STREA
MKWHLYMHSRWFPNENEEYISLRLKLVDFDDIELIALCSFYILSVYGEKKHSKTMKIQKFKKAKTHCFCSQFLKRDLLRNDDNELLPNGNLMVGCEIFHYYNGINTVDLSGNTNINESFNVLLGDIAGLLKSPKFSDCVVKVGDSKINVHKCILASRSEVFNSILVDKKYESSPNTIEINGFRVEVVEEMINFLYTGKSPNMNKIAYEMLEIGEKYKQERLKLMAEERLLHSLSVENVCNYLIHSELYSAETLKEWCLRFIYLNGENFFNSEKWKEVVSNYPLLIAKLFNIAVNID